MTTQLRPLKLGEILDRTAQIYRRNFVSFAGVAAAPAVVILVGIVPAFALVGFFGASVARGTTPWNSGMLAVFIGASAVGGVLALAATVVSQAALMRAAIAAQMGQKLKIREALNSVWPRFWRYLGVMILQGIFVLLIPLAIGGGVAGLLFLLARYAGGGLAPNAVAGFLSFLILAASVVLIVMLALSYSLSMPSCVAEEKPPWPSLQRSMKLSKGTRGRIFLMFLLIGALSMAVSTIGNIPIFIISAVAAAMGKSVHAMAIVLVIAEFFNVVVNFALQTLITPVYVTALVLFYYDQRIRIEGYDIEWMMERAGLSGARSPEGPPGTARATLTEPGALSG
jgi:hypothetical protein